MFSPRFMHFCVQSDRLAMVDASCSLLLEAPSSCLPDWSRCLFGLLGVTTQDQMHMKGMCTASGGK
jgi:hypothetical protein